MNLNLEKVDNELWPPFEALMSAINQIAHEKGFYDGPPRNMGEIIALFHSELSEWLEAIRHGNPRSEHIPEFTAEEEEAADIIIRVLDTCHERKMNLLPAIFAKTKYNMNREYKHGKQF